jgi:hypothetical protein
MTTQPYGSFIVRIWSETTEEGKSLWRATVIDTATREQKHFAVPEELLRFLCPPTGPPLDESWG